MKHLCFELAGVSHHVDYTQEGCVTSLTVWRHMGRSAVSVHMDIYYVADDFNKKLLLYDIL